jgi:hypothetical protein
MGSLIFIRGDEIDGAESRPGYEQKQQQLQRQKLVGLTVFIPTLRVIRPREGWGTRSFVAGWGI